MPRIKITDTNPKSNWTWEIYELDPLRRDERKCWAILQNFNTAKQCILEDKD